MYDFLKNTQDKIRNMISNLGDGYMLKQMAWNTFKKTGNIDTYLEFMQVKDIEDKIIGGLNGNNQDKGNSNSRK